MASSPSSALAHGIQVLFDVGTASGLSDRQLLERFAHRREAAETAFEALVMRHGPMVLRVCRNVLGDCTDAEDAFQATFLVLVKRSGSIRRLESVGSWLYGVACRVAARAKFEAAKRRAAEHRGALRIVRSVDPTDANGTDSAEFGSIIQEEVRRLPEKYRVVVALCYWQGLTQEQAAAQLGCPIGTVRSRLARARSRLHTRLMHRGVAPVAAIFAAAFECQSARAVHLAPCAASLVKATVTLCVVAATEVALKDAASAPVWFLTHLALRSMLMARLGAIAVVLSLVGLGAIGAGLAAQQSLPASAPPDSQSPSQPTEVKQNPKSQHATMPLEKYTVEPPDVLRVEVLEALPGRPIKGEHVVRPDGKIALGYYGEIYVAGMTIPDVKDAIVRHMQKFLTDETLGLFEHDEDLKPIMDPATKKPRPIAPGQSDRVLVELAKSKSKNYYVQGEVLISGRLPITGKETVLDAINNAGGLTPFADHRHVVLYRIPHQGEAPKALEIKIDKIMLGDDLSTDYQLQPGDRLVIPKDPNANPDEALQRAAQVSAPAEQQIDHRSALLRVEQRLTDVERKLDQVLQALKAGTP
jgi:polysaccharide export outer membrane protein